MTTADFAGFQQEITEEQGEHDGDLRNVVIRARPANPALQRLQRRVLAGAEASEVITSYDRMHHRHSRS